MDARIVRHGALDVVQFVDKKDDILRALRQIDPALFLEKQVGFDGVPVWCVVVDVGSAQPPITLLEWRDGRGEPIYELTSGLVERVARMERDGAKLAQSAIRKNQERTERRRAETRQAYIDMQEEMMPSILGRRSVNLRRGVHLRMARDRQRRQGRNV